MMSAQPPSVCLTRLAPSPTGALHLGNARTFLATWALARQKNWKIILRIEDIDGPRIKPHATQQTLDDLRWLGIDWDDHPQIQSQNLEPYRSAIDLLIDRRQAYPCVCTRKEIDLAASAPHAEDGSTIYPGTCRDRFDSVEDARRQTGRDPAIRFRMGDETFTFTDQFCGRQSFHLEHQLGDFVIGKPDGAPGYQLSVVVDDAHAGVTDVIRGDDLVDSVPRQVMLYRALGLGNAIPRYWHLPLVVGEDGRRLAKRHGDTRLGFYRESGVPASRLRALLARWLGMDAGDSITTEQIVERFDLSRIDPRPITFTQLDHQWLLKT